MNKKIGQRIRKLRELSGMSQQELSEGLGMARPTISQIESGERKVSADELIILSKTFNVSIDNLLDLQKPPEVVLLVNKRKKPKPQIRINVPQKNLDKFKEVLLYILHEVGSKHNVGETVIYKFLYFVDFDFYEKFEEQLIGATYIKNTYGPTPIEFKKIVDGMIERGEIEKVKSKHFSYPQTKYLPLRKPDLTKLKANEIKVIDSVLDRLSDMNATEISRYSHQDVPWLTSEEGEVIEYEFVFYRTEPYSVRVYDDDI